MFNLDDIKKENNNKYNKIWPHVLDHPCRILIIGGSRSRKTNALLNLTKHYLHAKDLSEIKYEFLIKKHEDAGIKNLNDLNVFSECSNTMDDVYEDIDDYNTNRQRKILIVFDDMIADIMSKKKFPAIIKELFIKSRKLNISLVFITQPYFSVPKDVRLNLTHYSIMKTNNRK